MPPAAEVVEGTAVAGDAPTGYTDIVAGDGLPTQTQSNETSWIIYIWGLWCSVPLIIGKF